MPAVLPVLATKSSQHDYRDTKADLPSLPSGSESTGSILFLYWRGFFSWLTMYIKAVLFGSRIQVIGGSYGKARMPHRQLRLVLPLRV
jgi:hypothetical protein